MHRVTDVMKVLFYPVYIISINLLKNHHMVICLLFILHYSFYHSLDPGLLLKINFSTVYNNKQTLIQTHRSCAVQTPYGCATISFCFCFFYYGCTIYIKPIKY